MEGLERGVSPLLKDATMNTAAHSATVSRDEGVCQSAAWMRRARDRVSVQRAYLPPTPASAERTLQAPISFQVKTIVEPICGLRGCTPSWGLASHRNSRRGPVSSP